MNDTAEIQSIPVAMIYPNPYQPRKAFERESLEDLTASIREVGVLQPLLVRKVGLRYELIAGERRLKAAERAGLSRVPALVMDVEPQESALLALIENLQRSDLTYWEEAEGYRRLMRDFNLTQEAVARRVGKSQSAVANKLRLLRLEPEVRQVLEQEGLTERHARALLGLAGSADRMRVVLEMAGRRMTVRETESLVEEEQSKRVRRPLRGVIRDVRIVLNTVKKALEALKRHGIAAEISEIESESHWEVRVRIPKR